jgi:hypothetical protein
MKLYSEISSERGKTVNKSGNNYLLTNILDKNGDLLLTLHITVANSHLRGEHYNIYIQNPQSEYIDITNGKQNLR